MILTTILSTLLTSIIIFIISTWSYSKLPLSKWKNTILSIVTMAFLASIITQLINYILC